MNRYLALGCLGLGLMVSPLLGSLRGAQSAVPANPKIGVINSRAMLASPAGKRASEAFEKSRKTKQEALDKRTAEVKKVGEDLEKQKPVLKPEVYEQKRKELEKKFIELQQTYVKLERELVMDETKFFEELRKQAQPQIDKLAKAEGVTIVVDGDAVVWADPAVDLTAKLNAVMK